MPYIRLNAVCHIPYEICRTGARILSTLCAEIVWEMAAMEGPKHAECVHQKLHFWKFLWTVSIERFSRAGPRGRGREWATLEVHPLSWLLSNNRLEKVSFVRVLHTSSNRLLLSNQDKGCTPIVAHFLPLPLGPALLNLWTDDTDDEHNVTRLG